MIRGLINYCNLKKKSNILDPFCGSGTTLIESNLLGFDAYGIDINPIACLSSAIKTKLLKILPSYLEFGKSKYLAPEYFSRFSVKQNFNEILNQDIKELYYLFLYTRALADQKRFLTPISVGIKNNFIKTIKILKQFQELKKEIGLQIGNSKVFHGDNIEYLKIFNSNSIRDDICYYLYKILKNSTFDINKVLRELISKYIKSNYSKIYNSFKFLKYNIALIDYFRSLIRVRPRIPK